MLIFRTSALLAVILLASVIQSSCDSPKPTEIMWRYESQEINDYFVKRLKDSDIDYRSDEENYIWFSTVNNSVVESIKEEIFNRYLKNSISFTSEELVDSLCELIVNDGHECETWVSNGHKYASWKDEAQQSADMSLEIIRKKN